MIQIIAVRPGRNVLARVDVQIGPHLRMFNLLLRRARDGSLRIFAPNASGKHCASFHPELATQITRAAEAALKGHTADDGTPKE